MQNLQEQIDGAAREILTDGYSMSIGELMSMYKEKEIDIHPEFQRAFRWGTEQKSSLIESILLGIPIPSIFVFQREDGVWDVIDGQQRLSTIFQFAGMYVNDNGKLDDGIKLTKTRFLPLLDGMAWESKSETDKQLTLSQRIKIKRAKLSVQILKHTSGEKAKYDLFSRLNSGGSNLTPQEIRTCLIIMKDRIAYEKISEMSKDENFTQSLPLTERALSEQENLEYVVRFIVARHFGTDGLGDRLNEYFDDSILELIGKTGFSMDAEKEIFTRTFALLNSLLGEDCFKRYNRTKGKFEGAVTVSAYEAIAPAVSKNINYYEPFDKDRFREKVIAMHAQQNYPPAPGQRSTERYRASLKIGAAIFNGQD